MNLQNVNIYVYINEYVYVITFLFLFLREFTRVKWSENENEYGERQIFIFGEVRERMTCLYSF